MRPRFWPSWKRCPRPTEFAGFAIQAPVLVLPNVFEAEFCAKLIGLYDAAGGEESGFMREVDGKTVMTHDYGHKRRRDYIITDQDLVRETQRRIQRRVVPEILKVHQFKVTRMERYIVSCYSSEDGGHFRAHRDNTTKGTAHRRFAVSINLNDDFDGGRGELSRIRAERLQGAARRRRRLLVLAASRGIESVRGKRYAFLPFLYDDEAAKIREANNAFLGDGVGAYKTS